MALLRLFLLPVLLLPSWSHAKTVRLTMQVEFELGSADIDLRYHPQVEKIAEFLKKYPKTTAVIEGHSDDIGSEDRNQELSEMRAESVRRMLVYKFKINLNRLTAIGYGESRPIADNRTAAGRVKNRRVVASVEATGTELDEEKKEIVLAPPPPPAPVVVKEPPPPAPKPPPPPKPAEPRSGNKRFLAGPTFANPGTGFAVDWVPIMHAEKGVTFEALAGLTVQRGMRGASYLGVELGYLIAWKPVPELELNTGAAVTQLTADASGLCFSLYIGTTWYHHLFEEWFPEFDRVAIAYTPILVRNANRQVLRFSLGFSF